MKTIFIQIASYRDPELPATIKNCLSTASHPERLRFGICWQYDDETGSDLDEYRDDDGFRIDRIHYSESKGCCWARNRTNQLYLDESYTLQIDAHMRFSQGWDERMIEMLESIEHDKPLLTTYPPPYLLKDGVAELKMDHGIQKLKLKELRQDLTTVQVGELVEQTEKPGKSKLLAAGYIFTLGQFCREVEYDPNIYYHGEEISLAARAYSHGYNLYYPHEDLIWHRYNHDSPLHWSDHKPVYQELERKAIERLEILLLGDHSQLGKHGLGDIRTLKQFEDYANIRFSEVTERRAKTGGSQ
jgi:glycosyltransferase involved in cell wall biosynthesis